MKIYWSLKSIPELKNLPLRERLGRWQRGLASAGFFNGTGILLVALLPWFSILIANDLTLNYPFLRNHIVTALGYGISGFLGMNLMIRSMLRKNKNIFSD
ncbi:hypothetical protein FKD06_11110 [Serratia sp. SRS-8-S-2018]|uniref:hypothetical protein n=1 Tax=Serratia TaxID=613 RepID=UPI0002AF40E0|nr:MULTISPECIES: hypothetical protein [Serratia]AGE16934.1 hypothetical protein SMWW4_v1c11300 [Serratia marcescens WW4]EIT7184583.1 hypothetical protein [Serratia marcescens]EJC6392265.1 hypothetical protein [Serratia marcescens]ERH72059.1 hypothetical protein N040_02970 [Serratia marcescens EGD-HP20]MDY7607255.1 hypothetical protein [Serratia marcescens]